jgi:hypothetical protein
MWAAGMTASHGSGPPRRHNRTPTRTGPTTTGPRSPGPSPVRTVRPGSDSRTNVTSDEPTSLGQGSGIRVSPSQCRLGRHPDPRASTASASGASCTTDNTSRNRYSFSGHRISLNNRCKRSFFLSRVHPNRSSPRFPTNLALITRSTWTLAP